MVKCLKHTQNELINRNRLLHPKRETQFLCRECYKYLKFQADFKAQNQDEGKNRTDSLELTAPQENSVLL